MFAALAPYKLIAELVFVLGLALGLIAYGNHLGTQSMNVTRLKDLAAKDADIKVLTDGYNARIQAANDAEKKADEHAAEVKQKAEEDLATADTKHQTEIKDEHAKTAAASAAARAGDVKLRYYADALATANTGSCSAVPSAPAAANGRDDRKIVQLPDALAGSLLDLTGEVDDTIIPQLHHAQDTIKAYYAACGPAAQDQTQATAVAQ